MKPMPKFIGERVIDQSESKRYKNFDKSDFALEFIMKYGQIDGEHHKLWVLDQVVRILNETPVEISIAEWDDGQKEERINLKDPTEKYLKWVEYYKDDGNYDYDEGIAP